MTYDTAKIRQFLNLYFNDEELEDLCFDYFREVSRNFTVNMTKKQKIRLLLEYCDKYKKFPHLLTALEKERSTYYLETFPAQVTVDSTPHDNLSTPPVMLNEVREVKHPDGPGIGDSSPPQTTAQNDIVSPPPVMLTLSNAKGKHPDGPGIGDSSPPRTTAQNDTASPPPVMLNEVREVKHPDGPDMGDSSPPRTTAQNDRGWMGWLTRLQTVPMPVWGVVAVVVLLLAWAAYSGLNGDDLSATPTTEVAQNSPAATQPVPPSATPEPTATPDPNVLPPNAQLGDTWTRPTDGMVMVYVPAGTFLMGSTQAQIDTALAKCQEIYGDCWSEIYDDEKPQHEVTLDSFWIDRTEVTNEQYGLCVQTGDCEASAYEDDNAWNVGNDPVVGVSWNDADAYCQWTGGSLPTEAQWEYAARGPENRIYPWGNEFDGTMLNSCDNHCTYDWKDTTVDDGYQLTAPVGSYPGGQSWVGAMDMAGNIWEWVADWYDANYYSNSPDQNPFGGETGSTKVLRGGSWFYFQPYLRAANRSLNTPDTRSSNIGFRCLLRPGN